MHDIKAIRDNPETYDRAWAAKGLGPQSREILELDAQLRGVQTLVQDAQNRRNEASRAIGQAKAQKNEDLARRLMGEVENLKASITENTAAGPVPPSRAFRRGDRRGLRHRSAASAPRSD